MNQYCDICGGLTAWTTDIPEIRTCQCGGVDVLNSRIAELEQANAELREQLEGVCRAQNIEIDQLGHLHDTIEAQLERIGQMEEQLRQAEECVKIEKRKYNMLKGGLLSCYNSAKPFFEPPPEVD